MSGRYKERLAERSIYQACLTFLTWSSFRCLLAASERAWTAFMGLTLEMGVNPRRGRGRREGERDIICWRFADAETAKAFADEFGGVMLFPTAML